MLSGIWIHCMSETSALTAIKPFLRNPIVAPFTRNCQANRRLFNNPSKPQQSGPVQHAGPLIKSPAPSVRTELTSSILDGAAPHAKLPLGRRTLIQLRRLFLGEWSIPFSGPRVQNLKRQDGQTESAMLIYTANRAVTMKGVGVFALLSALCGTFCMLYWYFVLDFAVRDDVTPSFGVENPMKFDDIEEYMCAYVFVLAASALMTALVNRTVLRIYYNKATDTFSILTASVLGSQVKRSIQPGSVRETVYGIRTIFLGNYAVVNDRGKPVKRLGLYPAGFVTPWYYNHLTGESLQKPSGDKFDDFFDSFLADTSHSKDVAFHQNLELLETSRKQALNLIKP